MFGTGYYSGTAQVELIIGNTNPFMLIILLLLLALF